MGDVGFALTSVMLSMVLAVFLTDVVGLRPAYVAIVVFIGRTWDYINDPIVGHIADRTQTKWGRYRPYMLWSAIPFGITFILLWVVPPIESQIGLVVYYSAIYFIHEAATTFGLIPYVAMTPTLTSNYDERTTLTSYRMVFSMIGSLIAVVGPLAILGTIDASKKELIFYVMIAMGAISALPMIGTFFGVEEKIEPPEERPKLKASLKAAFSNKPFRYAMGIYLFSITGLEIGSAMTLYFFRYSLGIAEEAEIFAAIMFVVGIVMIPFWNFVSKKLDKAKAFMIGTGLMILTRIALMFFTTATPRIYLYIVTVLAGFAFSAGQSLPWAIMPDPVEYDEYKTGKRREGMFYSLIILCKSIAVSISLPLLLVIMDASGYVANAEVQSQSAGFMIKFLFNILPSFVFAGAILCAALYPLNRSKFEEIQTELKARRKGSKTKA